MNKTFRFLIAMMYVLITFSTPQPVFAAGLCYVNDDANGNDDGTSWADAYNDLQDAIADSCTEIWVATGVYKPTSTATRTISFNLESGTTFYGGFPNSGDPIFANRNSISNITILSGDIDNNDTNTDANFIAETSADIVGNNSYHVVTASATSSLATLDGFTITAGYANGGDPENSGAGMYLNFTNSNIHLENLIFSGNRANNLSGGLRIYNFSSPSMTNITFTGNYSASTGGAMTIQANCNPTISNITFSNNSSANYGGALDIYNTSPALTNITFINNISTNGGGIYAATNSNFTLTNALFSNNQAIGGIGGGIYVVASASGPTLKNVTFSANTAFAGGGLYNNGSSTTLVNVTFYGNTATNSGNGIKNQGSNPTLTNVILWDAMDNILSSTPVINNSIVLGSGGSTSWNSSYGTDGGNNLDADPLLSILDDHGGFTQTHALLSGSPAINSGTNTGCPATDQRGLTRPQTTTCDIGAYEKMDASGFPTFVDVPTNASGWAHIEAIYDFGITGGCTVTPLNYCPNNTVTRAQMAIFLLRGIHGSAYTPPAASGTLFADVPISHPFAAWIEQLSNEGITGGCGGGNYCPNGIVSRSQMAIFLLRAKYGSSYIPPAATGTMFTDVPLGTFAPWIEQLSNEGITGGCGGGNYCPNNSVTRAQMAIFIQRTFNLPLP